MVRYMLLFCSIQNQRSNKFNQAPHHSTQIFDSKPQQIYFHTPPSINPTLELLQCVLNIFPPHCCKCVWSCYFKYNQLAINLSMSTLLSESSNKRRTSERRRLKLLKNLNEYKIANPYKAIKQEAALPDELSKQLKKIDYLSSTSIAMLSFQKENTPRPGDETLLEKMNQAFRRQEQRYQSLFGCSSCSSESQSDQFQSQAFSQYLKKDHSMVEQVITTKQQISLNLYDHQYHLHENMFNCHEELQQQHQILHNEHSSHHHHNPFNQKPFEVMVLDEDYEDYFIN